MLEDRLHCLSTVKLAGTAVKGFEPASSASQVDSENFIKYLNPFSNSPCKRKFGVCPIVVHNRTVGSDSFAHGSNGTD
jgi:hypothetical protein